MGEGKVLRLVTCGKAAENGENVQARLLEAQDMAARGGISNCIIIMTGTDGSVVDCWANKNSPYQVVGALEALKHEFINSSIEQR